MKKLESYQDCAYAALRFMAGWMFAFHGMQKVLGLWSDFRPPVGSQLWIGGTLEMVCGLAVALGIGTRWAAFLASGTMAVAYFQFHWKFAFGRAFFPAINKGELAVLYCFVFLLIATRGGGRCSLDARRGKEDPPA
jgi:putative oxidoreductase